MANLVIRRSDLYPVGTSVGAYPLRAKISGGKPSGSSLATATVAADGSLTFSSLTEGALVQLWAEVAGVHVYMQTGVPVPVAPVETLQERKRKRRQLVGA